MYIHDENKLIYNKSRRLKDGAGIKILVDVLIATKK